MCKWNVNDVVEEKNALDDEGFLKKPGLWTPVLAGKMAKDQFNIRLTELHMQAIRFVREYYLEWGGLPMFKTIREHLKISTEELDDMFKRERSSARGVICKLSGLPKNLCIALGC